MKIDYKKKVLLSSEEVDESKVEFAVEDTKLQLESSLLATKRSLAEAKDKLKGLKQEYPIDFQKIVDVTNNIRDLEDGVKILNALRKELGFAE